MGETPCHESQSRPNFFVNYINVILIALVVQLPEHKTDYATAARYDRANAVPVAEEQDRVPVVIGLARKGKSWVQFPVGVPETKVLSARCVGPLSLGADDRVMASGHGLHLLSMVAASFYITLQRAAAPQRAALMFDFAGHERA